MTPNDDYDWSEPFAPTNLTRRTRVDNDCDYCNSHKHLGWMPWHDPAIGCKSELKQHCMCQACKQVLEGIR